MLFHNICTCILPYFQIQNRSELSLTDLVKICVHVARGCKYLEDMHFVHRLVLSFKASELMLKVPSKFIEGNILKFIIIYYSLKVRINCHARQMIHMKHQDFPAGT